MTSGDALVITRHARRRFRERIRTDANDVQADAVLRDATGRAVRQGERTFKGQALWFVDDPPMRLVTKHDHACGMVLVTVLGPVPEIGEEDEDFGKALPWVDLRPGRARMPPSIAEAQRAAALAAERQRKADKEETAPLRREIAETNKRIAKLNEIGRDGKLTEPLIAERKMQRARLGELQTRLLRMREEQQRGAR